MALITLPVRYYRQYPEPGKKNLESGHVRMETTVRLDTEQTAFVLVDVWDNSKVVAKYDYVPGVAVSLAERVEKVIKENIKPALAAVRQAGLCIVHAPSRYIAVRYPQHERLLNRMPIHVPSPVPERSWPPRDFTEKLRCKQFEARYGPDAAEINNYRMKTAMIHPDTAPLEHEFVISSREQMDFIFRERRILHLIYVGFCTNACLMDKPGALRDMYSRGYHTIVLRDCTAALETDRTVENELMKDTFMQIIEISLAQTATAQDFITALRAAS